MPKLAIVIPAYKINYFEQTIRSIADQSCKDFTLYIGEDASRSDFSAIIDAYRSDLNIVYKRFETNLGGGNLVSQWERCIDMVQDEEWIWLFSDDDIMDRNCVEMFYKATIQYPFFNLFHFNVLQINSGGKVSGKFFSFPDVMSAEEFIVNKLKSPAAFSVVVEYIFKKDHFLQSGRFENFDLAWGSDDATWAKLGQKTGIKTIPNANVYWREHPYNISPNNQDADIVRRKLNSEFAFAEWLIRKSRRKEMRLSLNTLQEILRPWLFNALKYKVQFLSPTALFKFIKLYGQLTGAKGVAVKAAGFLYPYRTYQFLKKTANTKRQATVVN